MGKDFFPRGEPEVFHRTFNLTYEASLFELLRAYADQQGRKSGHVRYKNACTHTYRKWDDVNSRWNYTGTTCPYTGTAIFDEYGQPIIDENDDSESINHKTHNEDEIFNYCVNCGIENIENNIECVSCETNLTESFYN